MLTHPHLDDHDPEAADIADRETKRQRHVLEMIASENIASPAVMEAMATCLTNKYAEGYPGHRYYSGCEVIDEGESLAIDRVCRLFGAPAANVQPHSGTQANMAVYQAILEPGDAVLGMDLAHGGHLSHGSPVNFSGKMYEFHAYGVDQETERIDYDQARELARKIKPSLIVAGASAYPRVIDFEAFRSIADEVGAYLMVDIAHIAGLIAAGLHPSPVGQAQLITSTTHKTLRGPRGGFILADENLIKDINRAVFPGIQGGPLEHVILSKAVCFGEALKDEFKLYQQQIIANARALAEALQQHGFRLVSGGTDNHLILVDLRPQELTGDVAESVLERVGISVNKNMIPFDPTRPAVTSGIRIGTPLLTTRGMDEPVMEQIASWIAQALENHDDDAILDGIAQEIRELTSAYPLWKQ